jgi:nucleoside-diphosphate-sugar epimerase
LECSINNSSFDALTKILKKFPYSQNILITGATGFLGGSTSNRLREIGNHRITVVGRNKEKLKKLHDNGMIVIEGDLSCENIAKKACENQNFIFHCAALSSEWGNYEDFYSANVVATKNLVKYALNNNTIKRFIHVSSPSIYFNGKEMLNVREDFISSDSKFINDYAKTKYLAEIEIDNGVKNGLKAITIRPRAIFGVGDTSILPRLLETNKLFIPIINGGKILMDITYIENVVDSLICAAVASEDYIGEKYNITNGENIYLIELLEELFHGIDVKFNKKPIPLLTLKIVANISEVVYRYFSKKEPKLTRYKVSLLSKSQTLDIAKAKNELRYFPRVSIKEGIDIFSSWYRNNN